MTRFYGKFLLRSWAAMWILGEANEAVASGPPFFGGPPSKTAHAVLDSLEMFVQRTMLSEDFFFFLENTLILVQK